MYIHTDATSTAKYVELLEGLCGLYWGCRDSNNEREVWRTIPFQSSVKLLESVGLVWLIAI